MLESQEVFSYRRLAASYRFGYGALRKEKFMVSCLQTPVNRITGNYSLYMAPPSSFLSRRMGPKAVSSEGNGSLPHFAVLF